MSTADELKKLMDLVKQGILTEEEFRAEKEMILSGERRDEARKPPTGSQPQIGDSIGAYRVLDVLGEGGMGIVYRARHRTKAIAERQGGDIALKVLHSHYASNPTFQERFEREASVGLTMDHPGIVKVHDLLVDGGTLGLAMDLVDGRDMSEVIGVERGPIPWAEALEQFSMILDAVGYAHQQGVVHRDLKPENVMLTTDGVLKVLDFGIAKQEGSGKTKTGTGMGTVDYMAPEQYLDAKSVDHRADIYALGMTLYEMLAGRLPWDASTTEFDVLDRKRSGHFPPPTDFYPDIPPWLVTCVVKALSVEKGQRFEGCAAFAKALEQGESTPVDKKAAAPEVRAPKKVAPAETPKKETVAVPLSSPTPVRTGVRRTRNVNSSSDALQTAKELVEQVGFSNASLALLEQRALQKRVDTKFILPLDQLQDTLSLLSEDYALVRAANEPVAQYRTLYFDTPDYHFLTEHHRGRRPRYKVRVRHYLERELTFLEIKRKTNANTTVKARKVIPYQNEQIDQQDHHFIDEHLPFALQLQPSLRTDFGRITLVGRHTMERATFDVDLQFDGNQEREGFPRLVIAEIKQDRFRARSPLMLAFRKFGLRPQSISKYCTAGVLLLPDLTLKRFYPVLRNVRRVCES